MSDPEFPILGTEPLAVELANTRYGDGADRIDFLHTADLIDRWFAAVAPAPALSARASSARTLSARAPAAAAPAMGDDAERVRSLRDCIHGLLSAAVDGRAPDPGSVEELNALAAAAPTGVELHWAADGTRSARLLDTTAGSSAVLGRIATCCIELLAGPAAGNLRRCRGPGCSLLFVKNHSRRRWCHPSCGHRDRQARYYRRSLTREGSS